MINNIILIKKTIKFYFTKIFTNIYGVLVKIKNDCYSLGNNLRNITDTNMRLGIYHLYKRNYMDAIFRFKIIDMFLKQNDKEANYWLGWVYLLQSNHKKSIIHLTKAEEKDRIGLLTFLKSIDSISFIPPDIHMIYRDIISDSFITKFQSTTVNLSKELTLELLKIIRDIPDKYQILEIGSNIGMLSYEINQRMQEKFKLTSIEPSKSMIELQPLLFPNKKLSDKILNSSIDDFFKTNKNRYNIICSMHGFAIKYDLQNIFNDVFESLENKGYFAFILESAQNTYLPDLKLEFAYNPQSIRQKLMKSGFHILSERNFILEKNNNYCMLVCIKQ